MKKRMLTSREEQWRELAKLWSGRGGGLRLLILILGLVVLIVTFALVRVSGDLIWIGILVAWLAFITVVLLKNIETKRSPSSGNDDDAPSIKGTIIAVIFFTIILIAGLLFFANATNHPR